MAPPGEYPVIIEKIYRLLRKERTLLEAETTDWDRLEENLTKIGELFRSLPLGRDGSSGVDEAQLDRDLRRQLHEVIALRRENVEILQEKARELGRQITSSKQEKAALLAYIADGEKTNSLKWLV